MNNLKLDLEKILLIVSCSESILTNTSHTFITNTLQKLIDELNNQTIPTLTEIVPIVEPVKIEAVVEEIKEEPVKMVSPFKRTKPTPLEPGEWRANILEKTGVKEWKEGQVNKHNKSCFERDNGILMTKTMQFFK